MAKTITSRSAELHERGSKVIPGGSSKVHNYVAPHPFYAAYGRGAVLVDEDGVERLDFLNNYTSLIHGHADPDVNAAVIAQLGRGSAFSAPVAAEVELAELLCDRVASLERVRFGNSGTEAVMMAIKAARAYTGRDRIAKFEGHYHGYYDEIQVSFASRDPDWGPPDRPTSVPSTGGLARSTVQDVLVLPFNDRAATKQLIEEHAGELAAVIVDPLAQRAGIIEPREEFLQFLREITRQHGIVLIFDEVISFRVGYGGAQGLYGVKPDLTTLGKIMGGGFPVGVTGGSAEVMSVFDPSRGKPKVASGGTFTANPVTMVAGLAAMRKMTPAEYERLGSLGDGLRSEATDVFKRRGVPGQVMGVGSLFRILGVAERPRGYRDTADPAAESRVARLHARLLDEGIVLGQNGLGCLSTPMGEREVDAFVTALDRALGTLVA